jgi:hypothetical protein
MDKKVFDYKTQFWIDCEAIDCEAIDCEAGNKPVFSNMKKSYTNAFLGYIFFLSLTHTLTTFSPYFSPCPPKHIVISILPQK